MPCDLSQPAASQALGTRNSEQPQSRQTLTSGDGVMGGKLNVRGLFRYKRISAGMVSTASEWHFGQFTHVPLRRRSSVTRENAHITSACRISPCPGSSGTCRLQKRKDAPIFRVGDSMSYPCPQCGDQWTRSLPMVREQSICEGPHHNTITALGRRCAPPESFHWGWGMLLWIVASAGIRFLCGRFAILGNLGAVLAFLVFVFAGVLYNRRVWMPAMSRWEQSFICRACGRVFRP